MCECCWCHCQCEPYEKGEEGAFLESKITDGDVNMRVVRFQGSQLLGLLVKNIGLTAFKNWQLNVIKTVIKGKNTLIIQPTGSGKSLCFSFPPYTTEKLSVDGDNPTAEFGGLPGSVSLQNCQIKCARLSNESES